MNDEEFKKRLEGAVRKISPLSEEVRKKLAEAEEACTCKHCGRCVLLGPPCCYQKVYDMYIEVVKERNWLRKVQSKKDKKIDSLKKEINLLKGKQT